MRESDKIDIIIKSYMRFDVVRDLVASIREHYPHNRIIVGDDSESFDPNTKNELEDMDVEIHELHPHTGLSAGRNYMVKQVKSEYFLNSDDDHLILDKMFLDKMLDSAKRHKATINSASVSDGPGNHWFGHFTIEDNVLFRNFYKTDLKEFQVRFCPNFFIGKTDDFHKNNLQWDERLKLGEHDDFFLRMPSNLKVFHLRESLIRRSHNRESNPEYNKKRWDRMKVFRKIVREKYGFRADPENRQIEHHGEKPPTVPMRLI
jgi:hypothetical protein